MVVENGVSRVSNDAARKTTGRVKKCDVNPEMGGSKDGRQRMGDWQDSGKDGDGRQVAGW